MKITQGAFAFASPDKRKIAEGTLNHTKEQTYQVVQDSTVSVIPGLECSIRHHKNCLAFSLKKTKENLHSLNLAVSKIYFLISLFLSGYKKSLVK